MDKWTKIKPVKAGWYWYYDSHDNEVQMISLEKKIYVSGDEYMSCFYCEDGNNKWGFEAISELPQETDEINEGDMFMLIQRPKIPEDKQ